MKLHLLALTLAVSGVCAAHQDAPKQIRVSVQWIEVPHPVLTELSGGEKKSGAVMHDAVLAHVKEGKAKIVETSIVVCRSGQRAKVESIREEIYPVEYEPPSLTPYIPPSPEQLASKQRNSVFPANRDLINTFATRNIGVTMEVEPTIGNNDSIIELRFVPEIVSLGPYVTWMEHKDQWGDASFRMPVFESWRANASLTVANGKFELATVISPKSTQPTPAVMKKILLFVRADVITAGR